MSGSAAATAWTGRAWSSTVRLVVTDARVLRRATDDLVALLARVDEAASRFRPDSALSRANAAAGRPVPVPRLLVDLVAAALDAAQRTGGAVDPALGRAMERIGYDCDITAVRQGGTGIAPIGTAAMGAGTGAGWRSIRLDRAAGLLTVPRGCALDLGATAKAWTADRAAGELAARYGVGVLVELGGDLAAVGLNGDADDVDGGWRIRVAEREGAAGQVVRLRHGGLATSTTTVRRWQHDGRPMHHLVDPRTGRPTAGMWRTVSVAAGSALVANVATTEAIVRDAGAVQRLTARGLAARFVDQDGVVTCTPAWPAEDAPAPPAPAAPEPVGVLR